MRDVTLIGVPGPIPKLAKSSALPLADQPAA